MLNKMRNRQGFTLIELLIVVAIIGILAAVAIPQFSAYRMKGFNSAGISDLKNAKSAQEGLMADFQRYGMLQTGLDLANQVVAVAGVVTATGPQSAATATTAGAAFGNVNAAGPIGSGFGLSNSVIFYAEVDGPAGTSYILGARHLQSDTAYALENDDTSVFRAVNSAWIGQAAITAAYPSPPAAGGQINGSGAGGVAPFNNWAAN